MTTQPSARTNSTPAHPHASLRHCAAVFLALAWLALTAAQAQTTNYALGTTSLLVSSAAGTNSVVLGVTPPTATWTNTTNADWLQLSLANQTGEGSTNVIFTMDANPGATRTGTLTIAGQTLAVTQAGSTYVPADPVTTLVSSGLSYPQGLAADAAGNVYIADTFDGAIKKWSVANNTVTTLVASGLNHPQGVAVDNASNVYIADTFNNAIKQWSPANSNLATLVSSGLDFPASVAVDNAGNVYIADTFNNAIKQWSPANSNLATLVSSGLDFPASVAVDTAGNVYIADTGNNAIKEWTVGNSNVITLAASGFGYLSGIAVDGAGNVYVADADNLAIDEWTAANGTLATLVSSGLNYPQGVAVDGAGNVYIADTFDSQIKELPYAFVDPTPIVETALAGNDALPPALPPTVNLRAPFLPATNQSWLTITGISNGVVSFSFANNIGSNRAAGITLLDQVIPVTQSAPVFSLATNSLLQGPMAGTNSVVLTVNLSIAPWTATTNAAWLHLTPDNQSGVGGATVIFSFDSNSGATRTGALTIAGQTLTVTQAGAALGTNALLEGPSAGNDSVLLTVSLTNAPWTATTNASWLHLGLANQSGTGSATVVFSFDNNPGATRVGTLTIAGLTLTVTQAGPAFSLSTNALSEGVNSGSDNVFLTVTPNFGVWTATTNAPWLHLNLANQSGTGSATVVFSFDNNPGAARVGTLTIAGQTLTVTQAGPTYSLSTNVLSEWSSPGRDSVVLTVNPSFGIWTATTNATWLHLSPANQSGIGSATVVFTFDGNPGATRIGTLTIAGMTLTVTQAGAALGSKALLEGPAAGSDSITVAPNANFGVWTATANTTWLHLAPAFQSGIGYTNVTFSFDTNSAATRTGTLTIAGLTLTITQAGSTYVAAQPVTTLVSSGLYLPFGVALDGAGNVYIADAQNNALKKWASVNNTVTPLLSSGLSNPRGVTVDVAGNIYIADTGNSAVKKWSAANSNVATLVSTGLTSPCALALDAANNVYIADYSKVAIFKWTVASNTLSTVVSTGLGQPIGLALDVAGNVYIGDYFNNNIEKWTAASGATTALASGLGGANGAAVDGSGNAYVANYNNYTIQKWTAVSSAVSNLVTSGMYHPSGITADAIGNVYIADSYNNAIKEIPHAFVDPSSKLETGGTGTDALPVVLPATQNLYSPFNPTSDQSWLTITGITNGIVNFSFTANTSGSLRTAHVTLLGQSIAITQEVLGTPATLTGLQMLAPDLLQFGFTNNPNATFTVLSTTNLSLPLSNWSVFGAAMNMGFGQFQFTTPQTTNDPQRFYTVRSP